MRGACAQLEFKSAKGKDRLNKAILFNWAGIGWTIGIIKKQNTDGRKKIDGANANFYVHYPYDDDDSKHNLTLMWYGPGAPHHAARRPH